MKNPFRVKDFENGHGAPRMGFSFSRLSSKKNQSENEKLPIIKNSLRKKPTSM